VLEETAFYSGFLPLASVKASSRQFVQIAPRDLRQHFQQTGRIPPEFHHCRLPPIPPDATLADLRLAGRALRFFQQGEYLENPNAFAELTIADLLGRRGLGVMTVVALVEALHRCAVPQAADCTLEEEVLAWLVPRRESARRQIVAQRYGFGRRSARSLTALGASHECTKEWIRQICSPDAAPPSSVLRRFDTVLEVVIGMLPAPAAEIEAWLVSQRLFEAGTALETLSRLAKLLNKQSEFVIEGRGRLRHAIPAPTETAVRLQTFMKRWIYVSPAMQMLQVAARWDAAGKGPIALAAIEQVIDATQYTYWLDRTSGWFWLDCPGTPLRRRIEKALAAARRLSIPELAEAVWRGPAVKHWPQLPLSVFGELCRQLPECRVEGDSVSAAFPSRTRKALRGDEKRLAAFLLARGRACSLDELKRFAIDAGISRASLHRCLRSSPAFKCYEASRFGVPGLMGAMARIAAGDPGALQCPGGRAFPCQSVTVR